MLERELSHALAQSEFAGVSLHLMLTRPAEWARAAPAVFAAVAAGSPVADRIDLPQLVYFYWQLSAVLPIDFTLDHLGYVACFTWQ